MELLRAIPAAVQRATTQEEGRTIATPAPCVAEVVRGARLGGRTEIAKTEELLEQLVVLPLDSRAARTAGELAAECARRGKAVPLLDCPIGAIVREHRCSFITRDADHSRIPGLLVETY